MPETPLLVFSPVEVISREKLSAGFQPIRIPNAARQGQRLTPQFQALERQFRERRAQLQASARSVEPEEVLVLETVGPVENFMRAASLVEGLEWLFEFDAEVEPDEDFYVEDEAQALNGRAYLLLSNQRALREMLQLWQRYKDDPNVKLERGLAPWKQLFRHLHDIRTWQPQDRVDASTWHDWNLRVREGSEQLEVEVELFFHSSVTRRAAATAALRRLILDSGGDVLHEAQLEEIAYHALLARLPIQVVRALVEHSAVSLVNAREVMYYRPHSQCVVISPGDDSDHVTPHTLTGDLPTGDPRVALLDGLPIERHALLSGRVIVDDPDEWSAAIPVSERRHGTAMASAIIWGDLHAPGPPLPRPVVVRPILRPSQGFSPEDGFPESMPGDVLGVDLVHRAVVRLLEGDDAEAQRTTGVKVINLSVADTSRPFAGPMSPWARLLDWLSWKYRVLFVVSAGNHPWELELDIPARDLASATPESVRAATLLAMRRTSNDRRILSPSEAVNVLTVGALHSDGSQVSAPAQLVDVLQDSTLPSPISRLGPGYNRSIKPEVLAPGGRAYYSAPLLNVAKSRLRLTRSRRFGVKVAAPGPAGSELSGAECQCGTSPAAALVTRGCAQLLSVLEQLDLRVQQPEEFYSVALRTLAVHSASWGERRGTLQDVFAGVTSDHNELRRLTTQWLGYGAAAFDRVSSGTTRRATVIGLGTILPEQGKVFRYPLPYTLSGRREWRRLTVTLSWLTPIRAGTRGYRAAHLWFSPPEDELLVKRQDASHHAVRRGTLQHEVLTGDSAAVFAEGDELSIQVNCRGSEGRRGDPVPFALAVTLEVAPESGIEVFEEVRARLTQSVAVRPRP